MGFDNGLVLNEVNKLKRYTLFSVCIAVVFSEIKVLLQ